MRLSGRSWELKHWDFRRCVSRFVSPPSFIEQLLRKLAFSACHGSSASRDDSSGPRNLTVRISKRISRAYSPLHSIRPETTYPAILVTTADIGDRVVPDHSFKYVATLQASHLGARPHVSRVETRAGHGSGKPMDKAIEEIADIWAFAAHRTEQSDGNPK